MTKLRTRNCKREIVKGRDEKKKKRTLQRVHVCSAHFGRGISAFHIARHGEYPARGIVDSKKENCFLNLYFFIVIFYLIFLLCCIK